MKIAKAFRWEMGHRLPEHFGLCKNIHGHSYKMIVEFEGELNKDQMVIDYYDVEKIINPIINQLDHAFMVNTNDKIVLDFLEKMNSKKVVVDFDATAENICKFLLSEISKSNLPENINSVKVRVYETQFDYAEDTLQLK
ncbi:6-Pyruvoyl-tetrahydropterin synthase [Ignavibacterium album JCM 16511]|uniref:6-carboxy-5,6,7,8-tetrahydropterin synthase n=1 Tax=Ignavibacterium album (strain DSM 19864 / JCM 16511 / NBRC 101810 / Mat9-16) TaxID=945713 RepID=I0AGF9_IGNAJ|nr:6-carboxytetrahydropterin synthase [Ignavibacterium album]AFH48066.1 6-Pyruvoyl-tetrahydropterin synthase [Ignavibacterium album JCM 16511]